MSICSAVRGMDSQLSKKACAQALAWRAVSWARMSTRAMPPWSTALLETSCWGIDVLPLPPLACWLPRRWTLLYRAA